MAQTPKYEGSSSKSEDSLKQYPMPPLPFAHHIKKETEKKSDSTKGSDDQMTIDEATEMLNKMKKMHDEIEAKLNELCEKAGWTPRYLESFLRDPNNFEPHLLEFIQKGRQSLMKSFKLPHEMQEELEKSFAFNSPKPSSAKERRLKTAGRRRKWIPMK